MDIKHLQNIQWFLLGVFIIWVFLMIFACSPQPIPTNTIAPESIKIRDSENVQIYINSDSIR